MNDHATGMELALPEPTSLPAIFGKTELVDQLLSRIEAEARSQAPDLSTPKGRKAIASLAYKIAQSKSALDEAGKALNETARAQINAVDAERRKIRDRLDALKDEVRKPLTEWEAKEDARIARCKSLLARFRPASVPASSEGLRGMIAELDAITVDASWEEFEPEATAAKADCLARLREHLAAAIEREEQAAELERLRREAAERAEADRLRAEQEAAARAKAEADRIEAERQRIAAQAEADRQARAEREKQEAAARAAKEAEERAAAELARQKREAEEAAARAAKEAAEREAEIERQAKAREEALRAEIEAEKRRAELDAQAERNRIAEAEAARLRKEKRRAEDAAHRATIRTAIVDALKAMSGNATPERIADALMAGSIPHTKVIL